MRVAIYSLTDGLILKRYGGYPEGVELQCGEGEEFYLNCPEEATHIIDDLPITQAPPEISVWQAKYLKRVVIATEFDEQLATGRVTSSLGFPIDARRSSTKNDLQNMEGLAAYMEGNNVPTTTITDADDVDHEGVTLAQVRTLVAEIQGYGLQIYSEKRARVAALNAATTLAEVEAV